MPHYLQMPKQQQVVALLALGWSYRRIQTETGVRRETVGRYDRARQANAANVFAGSSAKRSRAAAALYRAARRSRTSIGTSIRSSRKHSSSPWPVPGSCRPTAASS